MTIEGRPLFAVQIRPLSQYFQGAFHCFKKQQNPCRETWSTLQSKGTGYQRWASVYNLKQMSKTLLFLRDHQIESMEQLDQLVTQKVSQRDAFLSSSQTSEKRLFEIGTLKKHIINYSKTRRTYEEYRRAGYSKNSWKPIVKKSRCTKPLRLPSMNSA